MTSTLSWGPRNPVRVSESIKEGLGCFGAAVADVNDLKRSCFAWGRTKGVDPRLVEKKILINNPFGNDSQKTPICVIKNYID